MMDVDPETAVALLESALVVRVLGPTAGYLGDELRQYAERRVENFKRILEAASRKLGRRADQDGVVPPRVLRGIISEGTYCDDAIAAEYFGGVLASSRSADGRDDRAVEWLALLSRMSTYQIRSHYIFYQLVRRYKPQNSGSMFSHEGSPDWLIAVDHADYLTSLDVSGGEAANADAIIRRVLSGLSREELIDQEDRRVEELDNSKDRWAETDALGFMGSERGTELFLWAHGLGDCELAYILEQDERFEPLDGIVIPEARLVHD